MTGTTPDLRGELLRALDGEYVEDFRFATEEGDTDWVASLTNSVVRDVITLDDSADNLVVRYVLVKEKETGASRVYKIEAVRRDDEFALVVTDTMAEEVVNEVVLPELEPLADHDGFNDLNDCIAQFDGSEQQAELQAKANQTCEAQFAHFFCPLKEPVDELAGHFVVVIIRPTAWKCLISVALPDSARFLLAAR